MGRLRHWIKRLEKAGREEMFTIPQSDGSVKEFSRRDMVDAYLVAYEAAISGKPADHPLLEACTTSSDPTWQNYLSDMLDNPNPKPAEDLSVRQGESPY